MDSRTWVLLVVFVWASAACGDDSLNRAATLYAPHVEWTLRNDTFDGNPFDLAASATFTHEAGDETRTTGMFYAGANTWKFRFTGTRLGRWTFETSSGDADLDGLRGTVTVRENPDPHATGFVTHVGEKWARPMGPRGELKAFVPQLVMYATPDRFAEKPDKIDADIRTFLVDHGFNGFHTYVGCRWFDIEQIASTEIDSDDPNPDFRTFDALELLITRTHAAGGMVHLWAWGDDQRHWTPNRWGQNGKADRRLQRYIAARLGPLPGWTMGYGFDNWEWVDADDLERWHGYMHARFGWPHLLGARAHKNRLTQIYEGLDYASYEQHRPTYADYVETISKRPQKPSFSEDRFRIRQSGNYAYKDYNALETRRGLWHSTMAGGVANIWGRLDGQSSELGSRPYDYAAVLKTYARFFEHRFRNDLVRMDVPRGACLKSPGNAHFIFYQEETDRLDLDLSAMSGERPAVAIDAAKPYRELDLGRLAPGKRSWTAPYKSDWAVAVGEYE